jgi:hypothetical protein
MKRLGVVLVLSLAGAWPAAAQADCGADCSASCDGLSTKDWAKCMEPCLKRCLKDDPPPVPKPSPPQPIKAGGTAQDIDFLRGRPARCLPGGALSVAGAGRLVNCGHCGLDGRSKS